MSRNRRGYHPLALFLPLLLVFSLGAPSEASSLVFSATSSLKRETAIDLTAEKRPEKKAAQTASKAPVKAAAATPAPKVSVKSASKTSAAPKAEVKAAPKTPAAPKASSQTASRSPAKSSRTAGRESPDSWFQEKPHAEPEGVTVLNGSDLLKRATGKATKADPAPAKKKAVDREQHDVFTLSVDKEYANWKPAPELDSRADEHVPIDSQHRVRAFATVEEEDLTFGIGPELLVRDQQQYLPALSPGDQPDVETGLGMRFQLDF